MKLPIISAGEFFELLRPAAYLLSALLSTCVLASARRQGIRFYLALFLSLGTFVLPFVVLPIYLILFIFSTTPRRSQMTGQIESQSVTEAQRPQLKYWLLLPAGYGILLLACSAAYLYLDYRSVDAHLARANQAKLNGATPKVIREYRAALSLENNPHTHKLLGVELAGAGQWTEALSEFRLAEQGGEPDESLPFAIARALDALGKRNEARIEYQRFLSSHACNQDLPDERCAAARQVLAGKER